MTIKMERWGIDDRSTIQPGERSPRRSVWLIQCHYCGYVPGDYVRRHARCIKCGGSAWELVAVPGSLLPPEEAATETPFRRHKALHQLNV